jgi:nicotinate phosphoribosyltransferase
LAGHLWGVPVAGTMAHSYILAFENEIDAFRQFLKTYPTAIFLIDTYDVTEGVKHVVQLAREMGSDFRLSGVRLDSGDLAKHANDVRRKLDAAGLNFVKIFASSSLDEYEITRLVSAGVPIDGFGVGRHLATSSDVPALDTAYKLVEYAGFPKMKLSESKTTLPGRKQIFRQVASRKAVRDILGLAGEKNVFGEPLLLKVMENGRRTTNPDPLETCRLRCKAQLDALPDRLLDLSRADPVYPVELSPELSSLQRKVSARKIPYL